MNTSSNTDIHDQTLDEVSVKENINSIFPAEYVIPQLPPSLLQDIEAGSLHKFGPHHANRQVLIDAITYDLINTYNLFYPSHKQFDAIGSAIVGLLKLPFSKDNLGIWKEAAQIKLKRKRCEHKDNVEVQYHLMKYSKTGSGRPVKQMIGEVASRDRQKQILTMNYDDDSFNSMKIKSEELRDNSHIDRDSRLCLWKETLHIRRKLIRDLSTSTILEEFPGYKDSFLIFEEIRLTMEVDLRTVVRYQVPVLLEKLLSSPAFITDPPPIQLIRVLCRHFGETVHHIYCDTVHPPPIQLIRVLCRHFGETVHHIYCDTTPSTPYPTLVLMNDVMHIFVDFNPIVSSTSPDDGLALILAMYAVLELNFNKNSRTIRLLYAIVFGDKRFISNSIRNLVKEKNIDISFEQNRKLSNITNTITDNSTTTKHASSHSMSQDQYTSSSIASSTNIIVNDSVGDNDSIDINTDSYDHSDKIVEQSSSSSSKVAAKQKRTRKPLTQKPKDKENCIPCDDSNDDEHDEEDIISSVGSRSSSSVRQPRQKKRHPPPIQLIRVLCRHFGETVHHIYCDTTPSTPYPALVLMNDVMHIFVDFNPIVSSTSPDDGLAHILAMYAVFELNFNKNSRTIRL
ncbi:unnamed protein product [Adineta steineri]|uniref:Uncharacterized protein n=1 Tax=Adineta steineri TaxID=433720 RepID=A0A815LSQ0_9BILA|nr:unnamed protein product [Adineta steineri]